MTGPNLEFDGLPIPWVPTIRPEDETNMYPYKKQTRGTRTLPIGWKFNQGRRPLHQELIFDEHVAVPLRDGVKIYCDIFRPVTDTKLPAILAISPYGKNGHGFRIFDNIPFRLGLPESATSGLEKFEGPDPAEWCPRGYVVVNVDIRGSWDSEGNLYIEGSQMGIDGFDTVEFIAAQPWCNGAVSMCGNSWLATEQWAIAIQKPPSLKCIAPWEAFTDKYRDLICRGGVPKTNFASFIFNKTIRGRAQREDIAGALAKWPLFNAYWADKVYDTSGITIPIYALASYSSGNHGSGTVRGWKNAASKEKWIRFHATQEWFDLYTPKYIDDLQRFFDRYLKGIENGWEETPRARISILTYGGRFEPGPKLDVPFSDYPIPSTEYQSLYLHEAGILAPSPQASKGSVAHKADSYHAKPSEFVLTFDKATTLVGHSKAELWMSCIDKDDMDVYVSIRKLSKSGQVLEHVNVPWEALPEGVNTQHDVPMAQTVKYTGPTGILRASHRAQDPKRSTNLIPFHPHDKEDKVPAGDIVKLEISLWPMGIHFEAGEGLLFRVQGFIDTSSDFPSHIEQKLDNLNEGQHIIHFGGKYDSRIIVPVVALPEQ
ncbi:alpha/beta-hydrolase [Aspergillus keveii]|uniref:Alpha/beta-hydrolase n=1 Tax=Aspergillus keveii TaxID=714993 RepID=A0ABR4G8D7_9EURO